MTALASERNTVRRSGDRLGVPVKAGAKIFLGSLVVADAGFAAPGRAAANLIPLGRADSTVDNTAGANGALSVHVERGAFLFENEVTDAVTQAELGKDCYIFDDQTVCKTAAGKSRAGKVLEVTPDGVWVEVL